MRVKMSKPPPPAPTASAIGPCPIVIKIVGRPGTGSLPRGGGGGGGRRRGGVGKGVGAFIFICDSLYQPNTHCFTFS